MVHETHETAPTQSVEIAGAAIAHRRFGKPGEAPLLLLNYFAANMDDWDPTITNGLAAEREIVLFDYRGIGRSSGETGTTVSALSEDCATFCRAIGLGKIDVMGFSLGGMVAQQLAHDYPDLLRRMILLGTGPRGGEGMTFTELTLDELDDLVSLIMNAFFTQSGASSTSGKAYLDRLQSRKGDRDDPVSRVSAGAQLNAIREWGIVPAQNRYAMLGRLSHPTLIVHGSKDVVVPPINAFILEQHIPNAKLVMYPDSSHGAQSQYAKDFLTQVEMFLGM